jgi:bifunctional UDP-N-acetylglucosamine pyrophosphorylase/glucosamine-1-phosphate N-acetyltransferase
MRANDDKSFERHQAIEVIILAAGLGTRMKSNLPKVLHQICGKSILEHLLSSLTQSKVPVLRYNIVVGYEKNQVINVVKNFFKNKNQNYIFSYQEEQKGTAHALMCALDESKQILNDVDDKKNNVLKDNVSVKNIAVFNGDLPLFTSSAFEELVSKHFSLKSYATVASTILENPFGYGRIIRKNKKFLKIVEEKDARLKEKLIKEVNGGVYIFNLDFLKNTIHKISSHNAQKEFYLPDIFMLAHRQKKKIFAHCFNDSNLLRGVNTVLELVDVQKYLYKKIAEDWAKKGVLIFDSNHTFVDSDVELSEGVVVEPYTKILGKTKIKENVKIGSFCFLKNVEVEKGTEIKQGVVAEEAQIGENCRIGPYVHLRPKVILKNNVKIGNFVEIKESTLGEGTSAAHLSYIGDAIIGKNVNIGCGFVTCNYDGVVRNGRRKHQSIIGDNVFIGSDSQVVAPIEIADGTYIASGSTVTESVKEKDSLVIARSRQVTKQGYAKKYKNKT